MNARRLDSVETPRPAPLPGFATPTLFDPTSCDETIEDLVEIARGEPHAATIVLGDRLDDPVTVVLPFRENQEYREVDGSQRR
jgi:hypothetical protein